MKQLESHFKAFQRDYYKSMVEDNKIAHVRARNSLLAIYKLCRPLRQELLEHRISIPKWEDNIHPSWEGVEE
tara:strand:- start:98 stop:313 length:216 start_codon:yes stop_codon:yes gene_type:complete